MSGNSVRDAVGPALVDAIVIGSIVLCAVLVCVFLMQPKRQTYEAHPYGGLRCAYEAHRLWQPPQDSADQGPGAARAV